MKNIIAIWLALLAGDVSFAQEGNANADTRNNLIGSLLVQKPWIVPIPGTTKLPRLEENIGAAAVELTADDLAEIDAPAFRITVQGARYPEQLEQMSNR